MIIDIQALREREITILHEEIDKLTFKEPDLQKLQNTWTGERCPKCLKAWYNCKCK